MIRRACNWIVTMLNPELMDLIKAEVASQVAMAIGKPDAVLSRAVCAKRLNVAIATLDRYVRIGVLPPMERYLNRHGYRASVLAEAERLLRSRAKPIFAGQVDSTVSDRRSLRAHP